MEYPESAKSLPFELIFEILIQSADPLPFSETPYDNAQLCRLSLISMFRDEAQSMLLETVILEEEVQARKFVEDSRRWNDHWSRINKLVVIGDAEDETSPYQVTYETLMEVLGMKVVDGMDTLEVSQVVGFEPMILGWMHSSSLLELTLRRNVNGAPNYVPGPRTTCPLPIRLESLTLEGTTNLRFALDLSRLTEFTYVDCTRNESTTPFVRTIVEHARLTDLSLPSCVFPRHFTPKKRARREDWFLESVTLNTISSGPEEDRRIQESFPIPSLEQLILYVDARSPGQEYLIDHLEKVMAGGQLEEIQLRSARVEDLSDRVGWDKQVVEWAKRGVKVWFNSD